MINIALTRYGEAGWKWTLTDDNPYTRGIKGTFRTDEDGAGLYQIIQNKPFTQERQIGGRDQFRLPPERKKAYARLRYLHTRAR